MDANIHLSCDGRTATVRAVGDVDLSAQAAFLSTIASAVATPGVDAIVIDLATVDFLDACGISALVRGRRLADAAGICYGIADARGIVRRVLDVSGVCEYLTVGKQPDRMSTTSEH
jgi:anti-sigma B factor antagonist